jgi:hypothetical protein
MDTYNPPPASHAEHLLPEVDAATRLHLSPKTMQAWRVQGRGPPFVKLGRRVFYRSSDLKDFIEENVFRSTAEVDHARRHRNSRT